jgi:bifunctional UDP-N-acetylglucosamine pyrophosphorylase/glucosamine-1-phosphate N-acetyltransferase
MKEPLSAVILAAGKSTRTYPITLNTPKGLLKVSNVPILQRTLNELLGIVQKVYIIVGYKKEMIQAIFGSSYKGIELVYVEQQEVTGTGAAILQLKGMITGKFLVLNGDDLYKKEDIQELLQYPYSVLAQKVSDPSRFGVFTTDSAGKLLDLIEKPKENVGNLVNTGCYLFDEKIFEHTLQKSPRGEYEITDYLLYLAKQYGVQVVQVKKYWVALGYSWDLLKANQFVLKYDFGEEQRASEIPEYVSVTGTVSIGKNVVFGKNVQLFGPIVIGNDVRINDNAYILPYTVIENDVVIDEECMIADSLIMDHSFLHRDAKRRSAIVTPKYTITMNT